MDGLWTILILVTLLISTYIAYKNKQNIISSFLFYRNTRGFSYLTIGLLIVLFFSRIFGTGSLWKIILEHNYIVHYKTAVQEGLELLGYVIILFGVLLISKDSVTVMKKGLIDVFD